MRKILFLIFTTLLLAQSAFALDFVQVRRHWYAANAGSVVAFYALTPDPTTFVMTGVLTGTAPLDIARTTTQAVFDKDGVTQTIAIDTAAWAGARYAVGVAYGDDGAGTLLNPQPWLHADPAVTQYTYYSNAISASIAGAGDWSQTGTNLAADNAVGLDGSGNTATTLTDDNAAAIEFVSQARVIPNDSNPVTVRFFFKADASPTSYPGVQILLVGGSGVGGANIIDLQNGLTKTVDAAALTSSEINDVGGGWWEWIGTMMNDSSGNTQVTIRIFPALSATYSDTSSVAATGICIVGNTELYKNKTIADVRSSGPIITTSAAIPTGAQTAYVLATNHDVVGPASIYIELDGMGYVPNNQPVETIGATDVLSIVGGAAVCNDGTNTATSPALIAGINKVACVYGGTTLIAYANGVAGTPDSFDGDFGADATDVYLFKAITQPMRARNWQESTGGTLAQQQAGVDETMISTGIYTDDSGNLYVDDSGNYLQADTF